MPFTGESQTVKKPTQLKETDNDPKAFRVKKGTQEYDGSAHKLHFKIN